jgi:hypothetical protein
MKRELLEDLIRRAFELSEAPIEHPSDEELIAYIHGEATPEVRDRIRDALLKSGALRDELMDMIQDVNAFYQAIESAEIDDSDVPEPLGIKEHLRLAALREKAGREQGRDESPERGRSRAAGKLHWWSRLADWRLPLPKPALVAVCVAAVAVVLLLIRPFGPDRSMRITVVTRIDPIHIGEVVRRPLGEPKPEPTSERAATLAFERGLHWEGELLRLGPPEGMPAVPEIPSATSVRYTFAFLGSRRDTLATASGFIPVGAQEARLWLISTKDFYLRTVMPRGTPFVVRYDRPAPERWFWLFTYRRPDGFRATRPDSIRWARRG